MATATRTIKVKFDGDEKGLIAAAAASGIAIERFEKQANKSTKSLSKSGGLLGDGLLDALGALPSQLKGAAIVAGAGIGVAMGPALASALIASVLLVVGGGVLAAGIVGAAKSPKVAKAWQRFARQGAVVFERFSQPFIKPLERAARTFGFALARMEPTIRRIGQTMAPIIDKLAPGFASMLENALPGILAATEAALPLFQILADNLPGIGTALTGFFQAIAAGGPGAAAFFSGFLGWVQNILPQLGRILTWVQDLGPKIDAFSARLTPLKEALESVGRFISEGMASAREILTKWFKENEESLRVFVIEASGFIKDTGPAFKLIIQGIAISFAMFVSNVALLVHWLNQLKNWWHDNKHWLLNFSPLLGMISSQSKGIPGIGARAKGGDVLPHRDYLVGEEGPEILRMGSRSGTIVPNHAMPTGGGGGDMPPIIIENHIEIGGEVVRVVRTEIKASNRATKRAVLAGAYAL